MITLTRDGKHIANLEDILDALKLMRRLSEEDLDAGLRVPVPMMIERDGVLLAKSAEQACLFF
jgi:hypothetical protein